MLNRKDFLVQFGKYVRRNRVIHEITQVEVAASVGIDQAKYSRIESGNWNHLDFDLAVEICYYTRGDIREFLSEYIEKE